MLQIIYLSGGDLGSKLGVAKSYSQVLANSRVYNNKTWTINKYVTYLKHNIGGFSNLYVDGKSIVTINDGKTKTVTINAYVSTINYIYATNPDFPPGDLSYLEIFGTYIK